MAKYIVSTNAETKSKKTTDSIVKARELAVKMLVKQNHRHSYARIMEEDEFGLPHLRYVVQTTGQYAQPLTAFKKGCDFVVMTVGDKGWGSPMAITSDGQYKRK